MAGHSTVHVAAQRKFVAAQRELQRRPFPNITPLVAWVVACTLICSSASQAQFRMQINGRTIGATSSDSLLLPSPPRELRRILESAESSIKDKEYSDAVEAITELLDRPNSEDFFLPTHNKATRTSLKKRALDLLGEMPADGREMYELAVGAEARRMLKEALAAGDIVGVREVSRRFFHTKTGYQATMLLARSELDQGRPIAAVLHLQRLIESESGAKAFDHELPFLLAACWQIAGDESAANRVVSENLASLAGATIVLGGVEQKLPTVARAISQWLKGAIGSEVSFQAGTGENWLLARGNAARNGTMDGGLALSKLEWEMQPGPVAPGSPTAAADLAIVKGIQADFYDDSTPALPSLQPLAVGDQLLFRTARRTFGGNIPEGRLVWEGPQEEAADSPSSTTVSDSQRMQLLAKRREFLTRRMCMDSAYGQMSSDGKRLFLITDNNAAANVRTISSRFGRSTTKMSNHLVAVELESEGKRLWTSMDEWEGEPFFLGAPLPIEDDLYAIAEIKDEIKLVCIDPATGRLRWAQQLAQVEAPFPTSMEGMRRLAGASPSFANGIMVCPTSSGAVVAVDVAARTLLWAHTYDTPGVLDTRQIFSGRSRVAAPKPSNQWADSIAVIDQGHVIVTPMESDKLICLDLLTGKQKWFLPRKNMLYVAGIHDGILVMIEKNHIRGLDVATGKEVWDTVSLPEGAYTNGRGFVAKGHYHLPIANGDNPATGALVRLNIEDGSTETHPTQRVLGNLICHGDYMISQGLDGIFGYSLRDRKRDSVLAAINADTVDPNILEDYANILASDGEREQAIKVMRRAYKLEKDPLKQPELRSGLLRMITDSLQMDFQTHQGLIEEAEQLASAGDQQARLDNVVAVGLIDIGEYDRALAAHLRLINGVKLQPISDQPTRLKPVNNDHPNWRVSNSVSLAHRIETIIEKSEDPAAVLSEVRESLDKVRDSQNAEQMEAWLSVLSNMPKLDEDCDEFRIKLADLLIMTQPKKQSTACDLLVKVANAADDQLALAASSRLVNAYGTDYPQLASASLQRIADRWPKEKIEDANGQSKTAEEWIEDSKTIQNETTPPWREGEILISRSAGVQRTASGQKYEVRLMGQSETWPTGARVFVNSRPAEVIVVDNTGQTIRRCSLNSFNTISGRYASAANYGNVLVVSISDRLMAIDMLSNSNEPLWEFKLSRNDLGRMSISMRSIHVPFMEARQVATDPSTGAVYGQIGAIGEHGVCVMKGIELHCLDLHTGQPRWTVRNAGGKVGVFGDSSHCYVNREATGETRVFEMRTGKEVDKVRIPSNNHWATFGRHLLHYDGMYTSGRELTISLFDCREQKTVWKQKVEAFSKGRVINNTELLLLEPNENEDKPAKLTIRNILDGTMILEKEVEPEKDLVSVHVWKSKDQYLVVSNHSDVTRTSRQRRENIQVLTASTSPMSSFLVCGHIYAFDRETKELAWDPIPIEQYGIPSSQPPESPLFVALRQISQTRNRAENKCDIAFVDRRTGKVATFSDSDSIRSTTCQVVAHQSAQQVIVQMPNVRDFIAKFPNRDEAAANIADSVDPASGQNNDGQLLPVPIPKKEDDPAKVKPDADDQAAAAARSAKIIAARAALSDKHKQMKAEARKAAQQAREAVEKLEKQRADP